METCPYCHKPYRNVYAHIQLMRRWGHHDHRGNWDEDFVQCSDHLHCLQPEGHDEDPELLAIIEDAAYEERQHQQLIDHDLWFNDYVDNYIEGRT